MGNKTPNCPNCSAQLKFDPQQLSYYCEYCHTQVFDSTLKEAENESNRIAIKRKEAENESRRMELEYEQRKKDKESVTDRSYRRDSRDIRKNLVTFCQICGNELAKDTSFCPSCGTPAGQMPHQTQQPVIVNVINRDVYGRNGDYPYKSKWAAFFLCLLFGGFGIHRFYVGKIGTGIIWLLTFGFFGIGWTVDILLILFGAFRDKAGYPLR